MTAFNPDASSCYSCCDNRTITTPIASYVVENIADLRAMTTSLVQENEIAQTLGYYEAGDGGGNLFYWHVTEVTVDNHGTLIKAADATTGRWVALNVDVMNVLQFGAKRDDTTDATTAFNRALSAAGDYGRVFVPEGTYYIQGQIGPPPGCDIIGAGIDNTILHVKTTSAPALSTLSYVLPGQRWGLLKDIQFKFDQPDNVGVAWGDLVQYKPAITGCPTLRIENVQIGSAWDGIDLDYYSGSQVEMSNVRIGAFNRAMKINNTFDNIYLSKVWFHEFGFGDENVKIYRGAVTPNPTTAGIYIDGECDGLFLSECIFSMSGPALHLTGTGGTNPAVSCSGVWFDGQSYVKQEAGETSFTGCRFHGGGQNKLLLSGGHATVTTSQAAFYQAVISSSYMFDISGGYLALNSNQFTYSNNGESDATAVRITGGIATVNDNIFNRGSTGSHTFTKPTIVKTGGVATIKGNRSTALAGGTGTFISVSGSTTYDLIRENIAPGWTLPTIQTPICIGSASFNASSGAIASLVVRGVVTGVTRTTVGGYLVAVSGQVDGNYIPTVIVSSDGVASRFGYVDGGTSAISSTQFKVQIVTDAGVAADPQVVRIAVFI